MKPESYKYVPIYMDAYDWIISTPRLYFNKGEVGRGAVEFQLAYTGELSKIQGKGRDVYRTTNGNTYYLTRHEAAIADETGEVVHEARLCPPYLKPAELPITTTLIPGDRGPYVRLNLHPEVDGLYAAGKVYFPDRSCAEELTFGEVVITEVVDKGSYGFFRGHNVKYEWPSDDQLIAYIHKRNDVWGGLLTYIKTKHFGDVILVGDRFEYGRREYILRAAIGLRDGRLVSIQDSWRIEKDKACEVKSVEVADLVCRHYHGCNFGALMDRFIQIPSADKLRRWGKDSDKYISDLMDEAADSAVVYPTITEQSGVFFYHLRPDGIISALSCFSREEMDEIVKTVNQVNTAAITQIQSLTKRGKFRLDF